MNQFTIARFPYIVIAVLIALLLRTGIAEAATATDGKCSGWHIVSNPNPGTAVDYLNDVATVSPNDVWAVGDYIGPSGSYPSKTLIEHWDGTQWRVIPSPNPGPAAYNHELFGVVAISANDVWAVGDYGQNGKTYRSLTEHWNGKKWSVVPSPSPGSGFIFVTLSSVAAISTSDVWAVGNYFGYNSGTNPLTEHWNGKKWSVVNSPQLSFSVFSGVTAISTNDVWAVGRNSGNFSLAEHWNGKTWSIVSTPNPGSGYDYLLSVTHVSTSDIWAVGRYAEGNNVYPLIEHWDGTQWSAVSSPKPEVGYTRFDGVTALSASNIWAVGNYFNSQASQYQTLIIHWDGKKWSRVKSPNKGVLGTELVAVTAISTKDIWAVGFYWNSSGNYLSMAEFYC